MRSISIVGGTAFAVLAVTVIYRKLIQHWKKTVVESAEKMIKFWEPVGRISGLTIYPIKSCRGVEVSEADCTLIGLTNGEHLRDRCLMVINEQNNFLHARIHPEMVLIEPHLNGNQLELKAPDMEPISIDISSFFNNSVNVKVWGEEVASIDCGDEIAIWLSRFLFKQETGARLAYYPSSHTSRTIKTNEVFPLMKLTDGAVFHDMGPYHLLSEASIRDLNSNLDQANEVSTLNFRPTIIVSDCPAFAEDSWNFIKIGDDAVFRTMKQCNRCILTTINPKTGIKHPDMEPLRTLRTYRLAEDPAVRKVVGQSPFLGTVIAVEKLGKIRTGDIIYAGRL